MYSYETRVVHLTDASPLPPCAFSRAAHAARLVIDEFCETFVNECFGVFIKNIKVCVAYVGIVPILPQPLTLYYSVHRRNARATSSMQTEFRLESTRLHLLQDKITFFRILTFFLGWYRQKSAYLARHSKVRCACGWLLHDGAPQ